MQLKFNWEKDPAKCICIQNLIKKGLLLSKYLLDINLQNFINLIAKGIQNSI